MNEEALVGLTVVLPPVAGLVCYALNNRAIRRLVVALTAVALIGSSILLYLGGGFAYEPAPATETVVLVLDLALLAYFLYTGVKYASVLTIGLSALQLLPVLYFEFVLHGAKAEPVIIVDNLSILMSLIVSVVGSLVVVYGLSYMDEHEEHGHVKESRQNRFFFYMLLLLGAMHGLVFSNSIYWMYFFWEITTLCSFELIRHDGTEIAVKNSLTALWMNLLGGVGFVAAMYIGYDSVRSVSLQEISAAGQGPAILLLFACLAFAAFTKSAQFPFNKWLQGAMVAPTPVSALLHSSTMVNAGIYLLIRIAPAFEGTKLSLVVALVGAFTFLVTAFLAMSERVSKGILAYSTIGNLGLIILCIGINTPLSLVAALTLLVFHSVSKGLLFLGAGVVENRVHSRLIEDWEGLLRRLPVTTLLMIVGMLSMFLPPFGMLLGKWVAIDAISSSSVLPALLLVLLVTLGSAATSVYYVKWLGHMTVLPQDGAPIGNEQLPAPYFISMFTLLGLIVVMGAGVASTVGLLVIPALPEGYTTTVSAGFTSFNTGISSFVTYPYWLAAALIITVGMLIAQRKGGAVKGPYLGGENVADNPVVFRSTADGEVKVEVSGLFLEQEVGSDPLLRIGAAAGLILIVVLFIVVIF